MFQKRECRGQFSFIENCSDRGRSLCVTAIVFRLSDFSWAREVLFSETFIGMDPTGKWIIQHVNSNLIGQNFVPKRLKNDMIYMIDMIDMIDSSMNTTSSTNIKMKYILCNNK